MADEWAMVRAERRDLVDFLESLEADQWDAPTLCSQWRVRDVAGHVIGSTEIRLSPALVLGMARAKFDVKRVIARDGIRRGRATPAQLIDGVRAVVSRESLLPGVKRPAGMLVDALLHHQDLRRPLGVPRNVPEERLVAVLDELRGYKSSAVNVRRRITGLGLVATDVDWRAGDGPMVSGPAEAIAMVLGGRAGCARGHRR